MATTSAAVKDPAADVLAWDQPVEYVAPVDPQPALHALDKLRTCIGGYEARSDEELAMCEAAMVVLQDYFADKDMLPSPQSNVRPAQDSAVGSLAEVKAAFKNRYFRNPEEGQKLWEAQVETGLYDDFENRGVAGPSEDREARQAKAREARDKATHDKEARDKAAASNAASAKKL